MVFKVAMFIIYLSRNLLELTRVKGMVSGQNYGFALHIAFLSSNQKKRY
ncbi:MAG: hypothetical protein PHQ17_04270 [Methanobacterium sp.]|jgi:hypothetical protein|nr:hypothetical protein [Methanobacterium sp.]